MSIYSFPQSNLIDEVVFKSTANGAIRAYLHARPDMDQTKRGEIMCGLRDAGLQCVAYMLDGKPELEVRGFNRERKLLRLLEDMQWIAGKPQVYEPQEKSASWLDKLRKRSLQASGAFYSVGDLCFIAYGWKDGSPLDTAAGVFYTLPTPVLLAYGRNDQSEFQIRDFANKMAAEFKKQNAALPEDCSLQSIVAEPKKGLLDSINGVLKRYPSEFMNLSYAAAGACILTAACRHLAHASPSPETVQAWLRHLQKTKPGATLEMAHVMAHKNHRLENWLNAGVGLSTIGSGLFSVAVKEKAHDPDAPEKKGLEGIWEWIQQRPLTIAGAGYMASTLLHAASTAVAAKGQDAKHKKAVPFRALFVASALIAELLVAISSKGHGQGVVNDTSVDDSILALTADMIVRQPKQMQNHLIDYMAGFLGREDVLAMKDEEIAARLREQVEAARRNPWIQSDHGAAAQSPKTVQTAAPAVNQDILPFWQDRHVQSKAVSATPLGLAG